MWFCQVTSGADCGQECCEIPGTLHITEKQRVEHPPLWIRSWSPKGTALQAFRTKKKMMPNYKDEWPLHVRWPFRVLFLGWWLTGQFGMSGGQYQLKPSISVSPGVVVPVGENVTIRCKREERYRPAEFTLYKEVSGSRRYVGTKMVEGDEATFQIIHAQPSDAGTYCCRFRSEHYQQWSDYSYKVHIKIKGLVYHKPIISMNPKEQVPLGADVTIQCKSTRYRPAEYYLLKEGSPEPTQMKRSDWEEVVFSIANVTLSDGGIYWCEYRDSSSLGDQYSQASDQVYLHVTDPGLAKPLIKMEPKGHHVLGAIVTIHCQGPEKGLTFFLYKSMDLVYSQIAKPDNNATTFSILVVRPEYAGSYTCHYQGKGNPFVWSEPSVSMKLVVKDPHLAKPLIQMEPKGPHFLGANVIIYCKGPEKGLTFFLYRSMDCVASQIAKPESNTSTFSILMVRPEDAGSYTCQYHGQGKPFVWSEPSASMKLVVKDRFSTTTWAGVAAGSLLVVLLLLFLFILYRKRRKGSSANDRNQPVNVPQEAEAGEDPGEVSYAVLNLNSLRTKQAASLNSNPESCVYAVVATNSIRKGP